MKTIFLILILNVANSFAQNGPVVTCNNCEGAINVPLPVGGSWYNPDQPGTGYLLEIQNGRLLGYYFGYDDTGNQEWLIFQGDLVEATTNPEVLWEVTAEFTSFTNGNTFNQPYELPENEPSGDAISLEFVSKQYARVSINGGEVQNLIPLIYGSLLSRPFSETQHLFPDLEGMWTFVYKLNIPGTISEQHLYGNDIFFIDNERTSVEDGTKILKYSISKFYRAEILVVGNIECSNPILPDPQERKVVCEMTGFPSWFLGPSYSLEKMVLPLPDFGTTEFSAEYINPDDEYNGLIINASRVNYFKQPTFDD